MNYPALMTLLIVLESFVISNAGAEELPTVKTQSQTSEHISQTTQQGHNFNNIVGNIKIVTGISRKQYRDDLNALEKELKQKQEQTIADLRAAHNSDKRQALEHTRLIQEKELKTLQIRMTNLQKSYQQRVENLQLQINELNEFSYLYSADVLRKAQVALANGDTSKAREIYTRITQLAKVVDQQAAKAEFNLGRMAEDNIDYSGAYQHYKEAAKRAELNPEYLLTAGNLAARIALYDRAITYYEAALALQIKLNGMDSTEVAVLWNDMGLVWINKGRHYKALSYFKRALASDLKTFGAAHPTVAISWNNLGLVWINKGQYDKALGYFEQALASDLKTFGAAHPTVATRWNNLGLVWTFKGQHDKAIGYFEQALASNLKTYGAAHSTVANNRSSLGLVWTYKGQHDKAIGYYEQALASDLKTYGEAHPKVALRWNSLGFTWGKKGQYDKAIGYYEKAVLSSVLSLGEKNPHTLMIKRNLEVAKQALKDESN